MQPGPQLPATVTISADVLYQQVDGVAVLLDLRKEEYYSLDDVGTQIWKLMMEDGEVDRIVQGMQALYPVEESTLRADLAVFFAKLQEAGLLQSSPAFLSAEETTLEGN